MNLAIDFNINVNLKIEEKSIGLLEGFIRRAKDSVDENKVASTAFINHYPANDVAKLPGASVIAKGPVKVAQDYSGRQSHTPNSDEAAIAAARNADPATAADIRMNGLTQVAQEALANVPDDIRGRALTLIGAKHDIKRDPMDDIRKLAQSDNPSQAAQAQEILDASEKVILESQAVNWPDSEATTKRHLEAEAKKNAPKKKAKEIKPKKKVNKVSPCGTVSVQPDNPEEWVTMSEFCQRKGIAMSTLKRMYEGGQLKFHKVHARKVLIHKDELFKTADGKAKKK